MNDGRNFTQMPAAATEIEEERGRLTSIEEGDERRKGNRSTLRAFETADRGYSDSSQDEEEFGDHRHHHPELVIDEGDRDGHKGWARTTNAARRYRSGAASRLTKTRLSKREKSLVLAIEKVIEEDRGTRGFLKALRKAAFENKRILDRVVRQKLRKVEEERRRRRRSKDVLVDSASSEGIRSGGQISPSSALDLRVLPVHIKGATINEQPLPEICESKRAQKLKIEPEKNCDEKEVSAPVQTIRSLGPKRKLKTSDVYSDDSEGEDAGAPPPCPSGASVLDLRVPRDPIRYIRTTEQLNKMKLSRQQLERLVHLPFFEKVAVGAFVRIMVGHAGGQPAYWALEITDVVELPATYQVGNTRTNKGLDLKHGAEKRAYRLEYASNQDFLESEFEFWRQSCAFHWIPLPTVQQMERKVEEIEYAMSYVLKDEDVAKIVEKNKRLRPAPSNYAMRKTQLMKELDLARALDDIPRINQLLSEMNELEIRARTLDQLRTSSISSIRFINDRNRKRNVEEAEKAILAELKRTKDEEVGPFTRRRTNPSMVTNPKRSAMAGDGPKFVANAAVGGRGAQTENLNFRRQCEPTNLYAAHNFEIGYNFDVRRSSSILFK